MIRCFCSPPLSAIESNSKNERQSKAATTLTNIDAFRFFLKVNQATNNKGFAIHENPAPPDASEAHPSKNTNAESPH